MNISVKIIKETKKAKLVEDSNGRQGWIQNRSYVNGKVNKKTFEKAVSFLKGKTAAASQRKENIDISDFITGLTKTGKAEVVKLTLWEEATDRKVTRCLFFPISIKKEDGYPAWLISKKMEELRSELRAQYNGGYFVAENNFFNRI